MGGIQNRQASRKYYDFARYARSHALLAARSVEVHALDSVCKTSKDYKRTDSRGRFRIHWQRAYSPDYIEFVPAANRPNPHPVACACELLEASRRGGGARVGSRR